MFFTEKQHCRWIILIIIFISINSCYNETNVSNFRSSNIEIGIDFYSYIIAHLFSVFLVPDLVILNATSTVDLICINHEPNDLPLEVNLSKIIPSDQIKISTKILNKTAIHIRLETTNYVGIFHLLCFSYGEQSKGTRTDVIVKGN
jgi:hypothetical protein